MPWSSEDTEYLSGSTARFTFYVHIVSIDPDVSG